MNRKERQEARADRYRELAIKSSVEASSLSAAKKALKEDLKAEYEGDFLNVKFNDAYRTSDDARTD